MAAARARERGGGGEEQLGAGVEQLVGAVVVPGGLGRHQGVFPGGGGFGLVTDTAIPATNYAGELGIGTVMIRGGSG